MTAIYKYPLQNLPIDTIEMPKDAIIRACGLDGKQNLCVWAEVDTIEESMEKVTILVAGTGQMLPEDKLTFYIGTVFDGPCIWHIYELVDWENELEFCENR